MNMKGIPHCAEPYSPKWSWTSEKKGFPPSETREASGQSVEACIDLAKPRKKQIPRKYNIIQDLSHLTDPLSSTKILSLPVMN